MQQKRCLRTNFVRILFVDLVLLIYFFLSSYGILTIPIVQLSDKSSIEVSLHAVLVQGLNPGWLYSCPSTHILKHPFTKLLCIFTWHKPILPLRLRSYKCNLEVKNFLQTTLFLKFPETIKRTSQTQSEKFSCQITNPTHPPESPWAPVCRQSRSCPPSASAPPSLPSSLPEIQVIS